MKLAKPLLKSKIAVLATLLAGALSGTSGAQSEDATRDNGNHLPAAGQPTRLARSDTGLQILEQHLQSKALRISRLVGMEVQSRNGESLGEVHDVLRSAAPGQNLQLIVSIGSADETLVFVPFDEIQIDTDGDELYMSRTREQLAAAPLPTLDDRAAALEPDAAAQRGAASAREQQLGELLGAEVVGSSGDKVGEVDDVVLSTAGADSIRVVLQVGGVSGLGAKRISLPLSHLTVERAGDDERALRVAMDREALERMPEFKYEERTTAL